MSRRDLLQVFRLQTNDRYNVKITPEEMAGYGALKPLTPEEKAAPIPSHYYKGLAWSDHYLSPALNEGMMARFTPSLFIYGARDFNLNQAFATHVQLVKLDIASELYVWDGLDHCFQIFAPQLTELQEAYELTVKFFDKHLGVRPR